MKIKRCPVIFNNVISAKAKVGVNEWHEAARDLRNAIIKNGLYGTGPIIYQVSEFDKEANEAEYTFYLPVNEPIVMPDNDKYSFKELWRFEDGLVLRHADLDEDIEDSYQILRACAEANELVKLIVIPRLQYIRACSLNNAKPFDSKEIVEVFEEAFR